MPSTTTPSGRSLHRPSSGYLVTWGYRATRLRTTYASVHSITTQWASRRRWSTARPEPSTATSSSGSGRRSGSPPTPDPTTEPWSRPSAWLGSSVTRNGGNEVAINRLRLGHSCLNHQLHLWGRHASGNCDGCGVPETIRHFLQECPAQVGLQDDLARKCARNNWPFDLRTTLCQPSWLDIVYKWLVVFGRRL